MADDDRKIWIPDKEKIWTLANLVSLDNGSATVYVGDTQLSLQESDCAHFDPSHLSYMDNLSKVNSLSEGPLLDLLDRRFKGNDIYT
jgi:myosin heavy subunit